MGAKTRNLSNTAGIDIEWQGVQTGNFTAVAGRGYFVDTTNNTITVTLPGSPSQGDTVVLKDYARTWGTNNVTIASTLFDGSTNASTFSTQGQTVTLVYMDGTKGWSLINEDTTTGLGAEYIAATGGTITTSGDYKIHTFTGDGCFVVSSAGNPLGSTSVDYLVVAGGAGGSATRGGGGGAGGYRESSGAASGCYTASPLGACVSGITVSATTYPVTVGAGGVGGDPSQGTDGSNSVFSTITSTGGGAGATPSQNALSGGSGGGGVSPGGPSNAGGSGNTPPVSPPQGNNGGIGAGPPKYGAGGGGGATANGIGGNTSGDGGDGGAGAGTGINPSACVGQPGPSPTLRYFAGGGGGAAFCVPAGFMGFGGTGGGGPAGGPSESGGDAGATNTGSGGGGGYHPGPPTEEAGGAGGKGIVIIRYKFQ